MAIDWDRVQTVLLDMDGTLLDLRFDNFFWQELIPAEFAAVRGVDEDEARRRIAALYRARAGTLDWYCLDHWSAELELDLVALKQAHLHRVAWLPGAPAFLEALGALALPRVLATNAHGTTLALKLAQTGLDARVDHVHSSHDYGAAKEQQAFWERFQAALGFDPAGCVLIDDNPAVLAAARRFGVGQTVAVTQPDSSRPAAEPPAAAGSTPAGAGRETGAGAWTGGEAGETETVEYAHEPRVRGVADLVDALRQRAGTPRA